MPIQKIPMELLLMIISFIEDDADKQSLRITSKTFMKLIQPNETITKAPQNTRFMYPSHRAQRLDYLSRLFLPGNLFHSQQDNLRISWDCLSVRDRSSNFPIAVDRDGYQLCADCIVLELKQSIPAGCTQTYNGMSIKGCFFCSGALPLNQFHKHKRSFGSSPPKIVDLCRTCHLSNCRDPSCSGWPEDFQKKYLGLFCKEDMSGLKEGCGMCKNCKYIGTLS